MIIIPAAGEGVRFRQAGYTEPKHLVPLLGKPLIDRVIENVSQLAPADTVLVLTKDVVGETRGTAETVARSDVSPHQPLIIANCDQLIEIPEGEWERGDAVLFTFLSASPAHSYVVQTQGRVKAIVEKQVVSRYAVSGVYWFRHADTIINACKSILDGNDLYLSRAIQVLIDQGLEVYHHQTPTAILGTPEDFQRFEVAAALCS